MSDELTKVTEKAWNTLGEWQYTQELIDARMADVYERFGKSLPIEVLMAYELEHRGGKCPVCGGAWKAVHCNPATMKKDTATGVSRIVRTFGDFTFYEPNCRCFRKCKWAGLMVPLFTRDGEKKVMVRVPGCGRWLVAEKLLTDHGQEQKTCLNCGCIRL